MTLIREEWFADMYSPRGRAPVSLALLSKVLLLLFHDKVWVRAAE